VLYVAPGEVLLRSATRAMATATCTSEGGVTEGEPTCQAADRVGVPVIASMSMSGGWKPRPRLRSSKSVGGGRLEAVCAEESHRSCSSDCCSV
jgi:hypothetical protein